MTETRTMTWRDTVLEALAADPTSRAITPEGWPSWRFPLPGEAAGEASVRLEGAWLVLEAGLDADPEAGRAPDGWTCLLRHGAFGGPGRLVAPDGRTVDRVRSELVVETPAAAASVARAAATALAAGRTALVATATPPGDDPPDAPDPSDLAALGAETGWRLDPRPGGVLAVDFGLERDVYRGRLAVRPGGGVRAWATLLDRPELGAASRAALGRLLVTAGTQLRLVRGAAYAADGRTTVELQVVAATTPTAASLDRLLTALQVGCRRCGPEAAALAAEDVAQRYMESFGGARPAIPQ